jgi:transcriptional regulator with XRE-family HTH domain
METKIVEIAERIKGLRELEGVAAEDIAAATGVSVEGYLAAEEGKVDMSFTFLYKCAEKLGVDIVELLTGEAPHLSFYSIVRAGQGLDIKRRKGFVYEHLAARFKNKLAEPFLVTAPYIPEEQDKEITLSTHEGQELDIVLKGSLKVQFESYTEVLNQGDSVYYDSGRGHGMIATGGSDCQFLAVVLKNKEK